MHFSPALMHVPDGFLSVPVALALWLISIIGVGYSLKRVNTDLGERKIALMGVLAAAIFAGQMLNFAVGGGTSGHMMGAAIATILVGPWAATLVMTCVVSIQALIFQDGGLLALGANIFNMGIIGVAVSYFVYSTLRRLTGERRWGIFTGGFLAAWTSIIVAALAVALELALSGTSPANIAIPTMAAVHALIGIGEGLITVGALAFIYSVRHDLLEPTAEPAKSNAALWIIGLIVAVGLAIASPLASAHPDGLEWVAKQQGFLGAAQSPLYKLVPDYVIPGISSKALGTIVGGVIGVLLVVLVVIGVGYSRRKRSI